MTGLKTSQVTIFLFSKLDIQGINDCYVIIVIIDGNYHLKHLAEKTSIISHPKKFNRACASIC